MAFYAPDPIQSTQFIPGGNTPASGALLFCYSVGTTAKQNTYTDASASTARTNPIVLDSGGNVPGNGEVWIASSAKFVLAPSNDTDPPSSPYWTRDGLPGLNNVTSGIFSEWVQGSTATFVGVTAFSVVGDQTALYTLGRRIKATVTGGDRFGIVSSAALSGGSTAVGITIDSSTLNSGLSNLWYGLLSTPNGSVPWTVETSSGINILGSTNALGPITFLSVAHNDAQTTVTSSANPNIWTGGNTVNFTGTTNVSSFPAAPQAGASRTLLIASTVSFSTSTVFGINGGSSTYAAKIGDRIDVIATSSAFFVAYPVSPPPLSGIWVPSLGGNTTYTSQQGTWVKVGKLVYVKMAIIVNVLGTGSPTLISGLPFTSDGSGSDNGNLSPTVESGLATAVVAVYGRVDTGANTITLVSKVAASTALGINPIYGNGTDFRLSGCYQSST